MAQDMLGITNSLFGVQPTFQSDFAQGMQLAGKSATDIGTGLAFAGGRQLGRGLLGAVGIEDPEMASANRAKQFAQELQAQGLSMQSAEGMNALAQKLSESGDFKAAQAAAALANQFASERAGIGLKQAQTMKALQEQRTPTSPLGKLMTERQALIDQGLSPTDPRVVAYDRAIAAEGEGKGPKIVLPSPDTRGKAFEAADPDALKEYRKTARAAEGQIAFIDQAKNNLPRAVVGQGLPAIIRGLNSQLAPLGINTEQVANTRNLEQALKSIIAQGIKQYGANPSTVDLQFAVQASTSIQDPVEAIRATLNYLEQRAAASIDKADAAEQYLLENKNLAGFEKQWSQRTRKTTAPAAKTRTLKSGVVVTEEQ
jgi:hypothetical protein